LRISPQRLHGMEGQILPFFVTLSPSTAIPPALDSPTRCRLRLNVHNASRVARFKAGKPGGAQHPGYAGS